MARSPRVQDSRRAARALTESLLNGAEPQPIPAPFVLEPDEFCVGDLPVTVYQEVPAGDGSYTKKYGGYVIGRSPAGMALGSAYSLARFTANVAGNHRAKQKAAKDARLEWRPVDQGRLFVTNQRFAVKAGEWIDLWYEHIRMSECDGRSIELHVSGSKPMRLEVPDPDYWFVMFTKLAYDRVEPLPAGPAPAPAPVAQIPAEPPAEPPMELPVELVGRWVNVEPDPRVLTIAADGAFVLALPSGSRQQGRVVLAGTTLTLHTEAAATPFTWSVAGDELHLRRKDDSVSTYRRATG